MKTTLFMLGSIAGLLVMGSTLGFWDLARHQVELNTGFYDMPFLLATVPWYIAGDLFISVAGSLMDYGATIGHDLWLENNSHRSSYSHLIQSVLRPVQIIIEGNCERSKRAIIRVFVSEIRGRFLIFMYLYACWRTSFI